jgi:NDP-mannose synthase
MGGSYRLFIGKKADKHDCPSFLESQSAGELSPDERRERHVECDRLFTIAAAQRLQLIDYGVLQIDSSHRLIGFSEKPQMEYLVSMGVYAVNRRILQFVPADSKYGFDDLMKDLLLKDEPVAVEPYEGYWLDIGRPDDYMRAIEEFEQRRHQFLPPTVK